MNMSARVRKAPVPKIDRHDWRNLPPSEWTTVTVHTYVADRNRELYGADKYVPMRNWGAERAMIKRALTEYGGEAVKSLMDAAFREYRPTREYPILTAGFVLAYMAGRLLPRILANRQREDTRNNADTTKPTVEEVAAWL